MRKRLLILMLVGVAIVTGCSQGSVGTSSSSEEATTSAPADEPLTIKVVGTCDSNGGKGMTLEVEGLTPNGPYQSTATYPDGREYTYLLDGGKGRADDQGNAPHWSWNCNVSPGERDPEGTYHLKLQDLTTHRAAETDFVVSYN